MWQERSDLLGSDSTEFRQVASAAIERAGCSIKARPVTGGRPGGGNRRGLTQGAPGAEATRLPRSGLVQSKGFCEVAHGRRRAAMLVATSLKPDWTKPLPPAVTPRSFEWELTGNCEPAKAANSAQMAR